MKLKTIFGIILGVVAVGLTSCSSDLTNGGRTLLLIQMRQRSVR